MRLRNVKNKEEILAKSKFLLENPAEYKGKFKELFKNDNPIYIEIGMGKGKFIIEHAKKYPNINFIGIEKYDSILARSLPKIDSDLNNLYIIRMDANNIEEVFEQEIDLIFLNHSDPWPKDRHEKRRLTSSNFLSKYDSIFKADKIIKMRTDNKELFRYSLVSFSNYGYILESINLDLHNEDKKTISTEYEDKFSALGMPIYNVVVKKTSVK